MAEREGLRVRLAAEEVDGLVVVVVMSDSGEGVGVVVEVVEGW